ncbi:MAG TPA: hypothetical protein VF881_06545 [Polyangiaceae bacterium]
MGACAAFTARAGAGGESLQVETSVYGGSASGQFPRAGCSGHPPAAALHYAGAGAQVRWRPHSLRAGFVASAAGAIERNAYSLLSPGSAGETNVPPVHARGAAGLRFGYDDDWLGLHGGGLAFQEFGEVDTAVCPAGAPSCTSLPQAVYGSPGWRLWPDLMVRLGSLDAFRFELGVGAYGVSTLLRPGLYAGMGYARPLGWDFAAHFGYADSFHGKGGGRLDVGVKMPLVEGLRIGLGGAVSEGYEDRSELEACLILEATFEAHDSDPAR